MPRTDKFRRLMRLAHTALVGREPLSQHARQARPTMTRREFVAVTGASAAALSAPARLIAKADDLDVGIVGGGLAGLVCAEQLTRKGVRPAVYEAAARVGGRCFSLRGFFPGQVAERGGEFIDTPHKTLLGYARAFGLAREDVNKVP